MIPEITRPPDPFILAYIVNVILISIGAFLYIKYRNTNKGAPLNANIFSEHHIIDKEICVRLIKIFDRLILRKYIFIFKKYNNLSNENRTKAKEDFLELVEIEFTSNEKLILMKRFGTFDNFKYFIMDFFDNRLTKLELMLLFNIRADSKEFTDENIYNNIISTEKDLLKIMDAFENNQ